MKSTFTTIGNFTLYFRFPTFVPLIFQLFNNAHPFNNFPKDNMRVIQPRCFRQGYKKLRTVGIRTAVGH